VLIEERDWKYNQIGGVFSLETNAWLLSPEKCMFGEVANCYSKTSCVHDGEEFVVVHDVETKKLGLFSFTHGAIFDTVYKRMSMYVAGESFCASAERDDGTREFFVVSLGRRWKLPPVRDSHHLDCSTPPWFILHMEGPHFFGGWCLYDAEHNTCNLSGCLRIFRWKEDCYVGVGERGSSTIFNATTGENRYVSVTLVTPIDDDRWIIKNGDTFGVFSLSANAVLIPPVFEAVSHIHGDLFFVRWQGRSRVIDLVDEKILLSLSLGAPKKASESAS
jgi:hypothetical protein